MAKMQLARAPVATDGLVDIDFIDPAGGKPIRKQLQVELDPAALIDLFRRMSLGRRLDREAINLAKQGHLAVYASSAGQEAIQVGAPLALQSRDWLFPTYRDTVAAYTKGVDPVEILALFRGTWHSGFDSRAHCVAPLCTPIASQTLHAAGVAMASRLRSEGIVAMALIGDGGTSEGEFHEALNFAAVFDAPCVFVIQNNQWAISVPIAKQTRAETLAHKAVAHGMPSARVDGNDVLAVCAATHWAVERARTGEGPTLIEALTYRIEPHTTSDDPRRYRTPEEEASWAHRDPLNRFEEYLRERDLLDDELSERIEQDATALALDVRERLIGQPDPHPLEMFDYVHATRLHLDAQRASLEQELKEST